MNATTNSLTAEVFQKYLDHKQLGRLSIHIPDCKNGSMSINVNLESLFRDATGYKFFKHENKPEDIEAMCVFGSVLYKQFPRPIEIKNRKKWFLFGEKITKEKLLLRNRPNDFDVMVITKENLTEDKIIIPQLIKEKYEKKPKGIAEAEWGVDDGYGGVIVRTDYGVHIIYRSVEQFLAGIGHGDTVSECVFKYGVPIIGKEKFDKLVDRNHDYIKREQLHDIEWTESLEGVLSGKIIEKPPKKRHNPPLD